MNWHVSNANRVHPFQEVGGELFLSRTRQVQLAVRKNAREVWNLGCGLLDGGSGVGLSPRGEVDIEGPIFLTRMPPSYQEATARGEYVVSQQGVSCGKTRGDSSCYRPAGAFSGGAR